METKRLMGARIKGLRRWRGLTQDQLAEKAGVSLNYLSRIERGLENPTLDTLLGLAKGLKVEPLELFTFEHEEPDPDRLRQLLAGLIDDVRDDQVALVVKVLRGVIR